jgi:hypothetical protein
MLQVRKKFNSNFTAAHICQNLNKFFAFSLCKYFSFLQYFTGVSNTINLTFLFYRKRPKVTKGIEKTVGLFARKDSRMDSTSTMSYGAGVKDLKAKSVAAALERVSP